VLQCVAVCCSVMQRVAVSCSELQCVAVCCGVLQRVVLQCVTSLGFVQLSVYAVVLCVAVRCSVLQCVAVSCNMLQCVAVCCNVSQCNEVCCGVLQYVAMCCSVLCCNVFHHSKWTNSMSIPWCSVV